MTDLHYRRFGSGPSVLLVHGWGLHGGIWSGVTVDLASTCELTVPDLPGHGHSPFDPEGFTLAGLADSLQAMLSAPTIWVCWSLGALVGLTASLTFPAVVQRLVLVAATPRFAAAPDWPHAVPRAVLMQFATELESDCRATLMRFLALQVGTGDAERAALRALRAQVFGHGEPQPQALRAGLRLLTDSDLRTQLPKVHAPALIINGSHDRLVPPEAGEFLAAHLPQAQLAVIEGAGHAPFVSHPTHFTELVRRFVHD